MPAHDPRPSSRPLLIRNASLLQESLRDLVRILQARDRDRARENGLSPSQSDALLALSRIGPMTVTSLGDCLHLEKSTASRLAKGLLTRGLIRKRSPTSDDRKVILQLTEPGMRLARKVLNDCSEEFAGILDSLDPESRNMLPTLMGELSRAVAGVGDARKGRGG